MKRIIIISALLAFAAAGRAQVTSSNATEDAQQTVQLAMSNALEITFVAASSSTGSTVTLPFTSVSNFASGVTSSTQQLRVRSNKNFNVSVKASGSFFTVSDGNTTSTSTMPVSVLSLSVPNNNTGGYLGYGFSAYSYKALSASNATLIINGDNGGDQTFSIRYKANPGFAYPAGTYSTDVVFTATQR